MLEFVNADECLWCDKKRGIGPNGISSRKIIKVDEWNTIGLCDHLDEDALPNGSRSRENEDRLFQQELVKVRLEVPFKQRSR